MTDDENDVPERDPDDPEGVRIIGADEAAEALERDDVARRRPPDEPRPGDRPGGPPEDVPEPKLRFPLSSSDEESSQLPHWTEPPSGSIFDETAEAEGDRGSFAASPRWRDEPGEWGDEDDVRAFGGDDTRMGALDDARPDPEDFFTFDDLDDPPPGRSVFADPGDDWQYEDEFVDPDDASPRKIVVGGGRVTPGAPYLGEGPPGARPPAGSDRDIRQAVAVGLGFLILAGVLFTLGPAWVTVLVVGVVTFAAAEFFTKLREVGFEPAALLGIVATAGVVLGTYHRGEAAIPVALVLTLAFAMLWFLVGAGSRQATLNIGVTLLGVVWIGVFGSYATALLAVQGGPGVGDAGLGILFGAILATVAYDVGGYFVGRSAGRSPLSEASPNKTIEGLAGGCIAAVTVAVIYGFLSEPFGTLGDGLSLGLAVAVAAPLGDLCQSLVKRDLGVKDMGAVLPGHGGFMDRFDALLFVLPTVYYVARLSDFFL